MLQITFIFIFVNHVFCRHWIPSIEDVVHNVHVGHHHEVTVQSPQKLQFKVVYDSSVNILSYDKQVLVKRELIPSAIRYFHETLSVKTLNESIKLQRMCHGNSYFLKDESGTDVGHIQYCKIACEKTLCGPVKVPEKFLDDCRICDEHGNHCKVTSKEQMTQKTNVNSDFILFVSSIQTDHCEESSIVAYASYCQQEHALNRPVAGFANLCPNKLETDPQSFESLLSTVKHEIYHALGFSVGLFAFYRDADGLPLTKRLKNGLPQYNNFNNLYQWSDLVVKSVVRKGWSVSGGSTNHEVQMVVTPTVRREARKHFNCIDLEGAELENQGGEGTALTHWEKRVFENEAMTGTYTQHPVFSRITLALMEDTGWYKANYDNAETLDWGKDLGCLFVKNNCRAWIANRIENHQPTAPFCATLKQSPLHMRCTHTKLSLALCNLVKYTSDVPKEFRYFDRLGEVSVNDINTYGGAVELADFCPFYQKFTLTEEDGNKRGTTCTLPQNAPKGDKNYALETYNPTAKCVQHGRHWTAKKDLLTRTMLDWGSGCYDYECTNNGLYVKVGENKHHCGKPHKTIEIIGKMKDWEINGSLVCPTCQEFCTNKAHCLTKLDTNDMDLVANFESSGKGNRVTHSFNLIIFMFILSLFLVAL